MLPSFYNSALYTAVTLAHLRLHFGTPGEVQLFTGNLKADEMRPESELNHFVSIFLCLLSEIL